MRREEKEMMDGLGKSHGLEIKVLWCVFNSWQFLVLYQKVQNWDYMEDYWISCIISDRLWSLDRVWIKIVYAYNK